MIVCLRTVDVPSVERDRFLHWIEANREVREHHGILLELVLEGVAENQYTVVTAWPSHDVFDAWIATSERDRITASDVHKSVNYHAITRYDVVGGYINKVDLKKEHGR